MFIGIFYEIISELKNSNRIWSIENSFTRYATHAWSLVHANLSISLMYMDFNQQLITEPTRITQMSSTLIDVIFTNCPDNVLCSGVCHVSISDHCMIFAYRKLYLKEMTGSHNTITYRNFRNFNRINFQNDIISQSWNKITSLTDSDEMWLKWKSSFLSIVDKHCPLKCS